MTMDFKRVRVTLILVKRQWFLYSKRLSYMAVLFWDGKFIISNLVECSDWS